MKQFVFYLIIFCCFITCEQGAPTKKVQKLRKLTDLEILGLIKSRNFSYLYADFKNQNGNELSLIQKDSLDRGLLGRDYYQNEDGFIKEVLVRPKVRSDSIIEAIQKALIHDPLKRYENIKIDCDSLDLVFEGVRGKNVEKWKELDYTFNYREKNLEIVLSVIANCGWERAYLLDICNVFQAAPKDILAYFYFDFRLLFDKGQIDPEQFEAIEDRFLSRRLRKHRQTLTLTKDILANNKIGDSLRIEFFQMGFDSNHLEILLKELETTDTIRFTK